MCFLSTFPFGGFGLSSANSTINDTLKQAMFINAHQCDKGMLWKSTLGSTCDDPAVDADLRDQSGKPAGNYCSKFSLPLPNEDFGRSDEHFRMRFRSTFQGCEYSIWHGCENAHA
jgi:hypothetical protein